MHIGICKTPPQIAGVRSLGTFPTVVVNNRAKRLSPEWRGITAIAGTIYQLKAAPVWYSVTLVSKKFFSLRILACSPSQSSRLTAPGKGSGNFT